MVPNRAKHLVLEGVVEKCLVKKAFLNILQNSQEKTCTGDPCTGLQAKDSDAGEFFEIFKNTYFAEHLKTAASICLILVLVIYGSSWSYLGSTFESYVCNIG